jgi:ubiquinone/menaquinone biosynthesis C-methylase UbiE
MAWLEDLGLIAVGLDYSSGMLAQARVRARGPLLQMDMRRLGLTARQFEGIWCCASLLHVSKSEACTALAEMHRVLRPGGLLFLSVQEGEGEAWEACPHAEVERCFARYEREELAALLVQTGLSVIESASNEGGSRHWLQFFAQSCRSR